MRIFLFRIILAIFLIIILSNLGIAYTYKANFTSGPKEIEIEPGVPGLEAYISFGKIQSYLDYPWYCRPPDPVFGVIVEKQSPSDPDCWDTVYVGITGNAGYYFSETLHGEGSLEYLDNSGGDFTCFWPFHCGFNNFRLRVWPLKSGKYRVTIRSIDWYLWPDECDERKYWIPYQSFAFYDSDYKEIKIASDAQDFARFIQIYYHGQQLNDTTFDEGSLHVFSDYHIITKILSTKPDELMPQSIKGYLAPEGVLNPIQVTLSRWTEGDWEPQCDPDLQFRIYAYRSNQTINPFELWNYTEQEWASITKDLTFDLYGQENDVDNDKEITVHVLSLINLDCQNDTTVSFIPVKGEQMPFVFRYSAALDVGQGTEMTFNITDNSDNLVYSEPLALIKFEFDWGNFGFPGLPGYMAIPISWDGRDNQNIIDPGHCVNPASDPYKAHVYIDDPNGEIMSNIEEFNVVPMIDSVLVTHTPWYPPPPAFFENNIDIYSLIRAKIYDSGNSYADFAYYYPQGEVYPFRLGFWDGSTNRYWDLSPNVYPVVNYYRYLDHWVPSPVSEWNSICWGNLTYEWYEVFDYARREIGGEKRQILYYEDVNQTQAWGTNWHTTISRYIDWLDRSIFHVPPRMRFWVRSKISNSLAGYEIQNEISAEKAGAHQIILGRGGNPNSWDNFDWAVSHIGTPYYFPDDERRAKKPYTYVDCSGLVVASRIQKIDSWNNDCYRINNNNVQHLVDGFYYYPPTPEGQNPDPNDKVDLDIDPIDPTEANKGDLVAIRKHVPTINPSAVYKHIVIVDWLDIDPFDPLSVLHCYGIHARGDSQINFRRVRYDNILGRYRQWRPGRPPDRDRDYIFLRFLQP